MPYFPKPIQATRYIQPFTEEEESSLLDDGLSALQWLGETLDKPARSAREAAAEVRSWCYGPEHDFNPREMMAWVPYSDKMGLTDPKDITTGREVVGGMDPDDPWQGAAGFAAEVVLDPLNLVTLGGAGALSKGGKVLNRMSNSALDEVLEASAKAAGRTPEGGLLKKYTKMDTTVKEGIQNYKNKLKDTLAPEDFAKKSKEFDNEFWQTAQKMGYESVTKDEILNQPIGGLLGRNEFSPLGAFRDTVGTLGHGDMAKSIAYKAGQAKHHILNLPGITHAQSWFDRSVMGATTAAGKYIGRMVDRKSGQSVAAERLNASHAISIKQKLPELFDTNSILRANPKMKRQAAQRLVTKNNIWLTHAIEKPDAVLPDHIPKDLVDAVRELNDRGNSLRKQAADKGIYFPELDDLEIKHAPRQRVRAFGEIREGVHNVDDKRLLDVTHGSQEARDDWSRDLIDGLAGINELSIDPNISGRAHILGRHRTPDAAEASLRSIMGEFMEQEGGAHTVFSNPEFMLAYVKKAIEIGPNGGTVTAPVRFQGRVVNVPVTGIHDVRKRFIRDGKHANGDPIIRPIGDIEQDEHLMNIVERIAKLDRRHSREGIPMYVADPIQNAVDYNIKLERSLGAYDQIVEQLADKVAKKSDPQIMRGYYVPLSKVLDDLDLTTRTLQDKTTIIDGRFLDEVEEVSEASIKAYRKIATKLDPDLKHVSDDELRKLMRNHNHRSALYVPDSLAHEVTRMLTSYTNPEGMESFQTFIRGYDKFMNALRAGVTSIFPSFMTRNLVGGQFNNWIIRAWSVPSLYDASNTIAGNTVSGAGRANWDISKLPRALQEEVERAGGEISDELGTRIGLYHIYAHNLWTPDINAVHMDIMDQHQGLDAIGEMIAKSEVPTSNAAKAAEYLENLLTRDEYGNWKWTAADIVGATAGINPLLHGVGLGIPFAPGATFGKGAFGDATRPVSKLQTLGHKLSAQVEAYNRIAPFWKLVKDGWTPEAAIRQVKKAQVDYSNLSQFEKKYMRRGFFFYTFSRGMVPFVLEEMITRPSGRMMQVIRASGRAKSQDPNTPYLPEYIRQGVAIPLGGEDPNKPSYISSLGLPFEDTLEYLGGMGADEGMIQGTLESLVGRTTPPFQSIMSATYGKDLFRGRRPEEIPTDVKYTEDGKAIPVPTGSMAKYLLNLVPGYSRAPKAGKFFERHDEVGREKWGGYYPRILQDFGEKGWKDTPGLPFSTREIYDMQKQKEKTMQDRLNQLLMSMGGYYEMNMVNPIGGVDAGYVKQIEPGSPEETLEMLRQYQAKRRSDRARQPR